MAMQMSYTEARANFARVCDTVRDDRETVIVTRHGEPEVAIIAADELASLQETAYLLRSPRNAARLLAALTRSLEGVEKPQTIEDLKREFGIDAEE